MAGESAYYKLKKPTPEDIYSVENQNDNMDAIDTALHELEVGKAGLDEGGKVMVKQIPALPYDPEGSAERVREALEADNEALAAEVLSLSNANAALEARVARLEDALFSNITGNPFSINFDNLTGIALEQGVWNAARQRLEC